MLNKIYKFFGHSIQLLKMKEELLEVFDAFTDYILYPCKENIEHLLEEINDLLNVVQGVAQCRYGSNIVESERVKNSKLIRTVEIISECDPTKDKIEEYERVRKKYE